MWSNISAPVNTALAWARAAPSPAHRCLSPTGLPRLESDVDADPAGFRVLEPPAEPGDVVLLDSRTLHAAGGQCPEDFVRLSIRYTHPETARRDRSWPTATFWDEFSWAPGERLPAQAFPRASALAGAV
jgi:hypothetical protein